MQNDKKRSKRLRKKLYLGEFAVMGFEFTCRINLKEESEFDDLFDGLADLMAQRDLLVIGGGSEESFEGYVVSSERYQSTTEEDRKAVEQWLSAQSSISDATVAELTDAHYG
ncbi:YggL family protein [Aestuariirhabdus sp. Z084]|uniref:50S ribosome-binding protein YggL n=1 Tax=Aestuariirhabdus haliotis TaxID=2918751 RepID=UPI00201B45E9|nr:50S ribosome-binding protein YggL [Aestuariirhabdus haliotis]MCL6416749.1 YggL family protein [Aestuariirhabdus haliotis]MCL6420749.1 YggL family protein [Aestuariirhabdus haliotis]